MPTGKVRFYNAEKGFGFLTTNEGVDVYVHASSLPDGATALKPGQKVEFGIAEGRKGLQALSVTLTDPLPSVVKSSRKPAESLIPIIEDLMKVLEDVGEGLRHGRYPADDKARTAAAVLRAVATDLDV